MTSDVFHGLLFEVLVSTELNSSFRLAKRTLSETVFCYITSNLTMSFEEFLRAYAVLTKPEDTEISDLTFKLFEVSQPSDSYAVARKIKSRALNLLDLSETMIDQFLKANDIKEEDKISREMFREVYARNENHDIFKWVERMGAGFNGLENGERVKEFSEEKEGVD